MRVRWLLISCLRRPGAAHRDSLLSHGDDRWWYRNWCHRNRRDRDGCYGRDAHRNSSHAGGDCSKSTRCHGCVDHLLRCRSLRRRNRIRNRDCRDRYSRYVRGSLARHSQLGILVQQKLVRRCQIANLEQDKAYIQLEAKSIFQMFLFIFFFLFSFSDIPASLTLLSSFSTMHSHPPVQWLVLRYAVSRDNNNLA